jgi:hypothetical protein
MRNPWLKKNPLMSIWLSGLNSVAHASRGQAAAEASRQYQALMAEGTRQWLRLYSGGLLASPTSKKSPARRKRSTRR